MKFSVELYYDTETDLQRFEMLREDGSTLADVPASTSCMSIRQGLKTLFPECEVVFADNWDLVMV